MKVRRGRYTLEVGDDAVKLYERHMVEEEVCRSPHVDVLVEEAPWEERGGLRYAQVGEFLVVQHGGKLYVGRTAKWLDVEVLEWILDILEGRAKPVEP